MFSVIYLDMDGVIVDFARGLLEAHNRPDLVAAYEVGTYPRQWDFEGKLGTEEEIWKPVNKQGVSFWVSLKAHSWANKIIQALEASGVEWFFCSKPVNTIGGYAGKFAWLNSHYPQFTEDKIIFLQHKDLLAHPRALLIDDNETNLLDFEMAGGNTSLFPQPWNTDDVVVYRKEWLDNLYAIIMDDKYAYLGLM